MSYKEGDKFIIEIEEVYKSDLTSPDLYRVKGFNSLVFDNHGLNKLQKVEDTPAVKQILTDDEALVMRPIDADALKEKFPHNSDWEYPVNTNSDVVEAINEMPTVKAEPEHGHWVINGEWCTCSECKQSIHYERSKGKSNLINALSMAVNFCPNCGAKMDEKVTRGTE